MGTGRALAIDLGTRRVGLALSDVSGTLARPFKTLQVTGVTTLDVVVAEVDSLMRDADGLRVIVVGVPARLDGQASDDTRRARAFIDQLRSRVSVPVVGEDERLTSREAEQRLALRERDWRKRKAQLDAAAAAVFLQDFLDRGAPVC
ncbi:MAG: Holliday junction resolvase RuvX [Acidimicrobiia bacterium]|nr:Holliday junction resolvase RuvX [Acidimicrobiia bacterium]